MMTIEVSLLPTVRSLFQMVSGTPAISYRFRGFLKVLSFGVWNTFRMVCNGVWEVVERNSHG